VEFDWRKYDRDTFEMYISEIRSYAESVEKLLLEHSREFERNAPGPPPGISKEAQWTYWENYAGDLDELQRKFPKILRYSLFVHSYSLFESRLMYIAKYYQKTRNLKLSPSDLQDKGIKQAQVYLKKFVSIPFPDEGGSAWQEISTLDIIRNMIVHNEGKLPQKDEKNFKLIEDFAKKWHGDISTEYSDIELHKTFVFRVLKTFHTFFKELFTNLPSE